MNIESIYKSPHGEKLIMEFYERMLSKWPVEYSEADIDTSFGTTHVIISGNPANPPLVLLHGSTSNSVTWAGDIKEYSAHFRVYAPDMPGEPGKSTQRRLSWSNDDYPRWLLQVVETIKLKNPHIAGLSLGGWAAMKFASAYPGRVGKIALIAPGGIVNPNMKALLKMIRYASQGEKGVDKTLQLLFPDDFESAEVREFFTLLNEHFIIRTESVKPLADETLAKITSPLFMVAGDNDVFFNFKKAEKRLKKLIPQSETLLLKKGTHGLVAMAGTVIPFFNS